MARQKNNKGLNIKEAEAHNYPLRHRHVLTLKEQQNPPLGVI